MLSVSQEKKGCNVFKVDLGWHGSVTVKNEHLKLRHVKLVNVDGADLLQDSCTLLSSLLCIEEVANVETMELFWL